MTSLILLLLASVTNACMDTLKDHFSVSIFQNFKQEFWNPAISWQKKTFITYRVDAWHIFKSITIILICFSIVFYKPITKYVLADVAILGMTWNVVFEIMYRLLRKIK